MKNQRLFEDVYEKHKDRIYRLCCILVHDRTQTDDLYQEVLINIWKGIDQFQGKAKIETWIYRVVLNASINFNLKQKSRREIVGDLPELPETISPEKGQTEILLEKIGLLKSTDRALIGLYLEGYAYKEIAEILGMTPTHVGVKINRIKTQLKSIWNTKI
ncbi:MAG: RNA polymerase sigma factor [Bacteroidia bacterium]